VTAPKPWRRLAVEGDGLRAVLLPDKGAELVELHDLRTGIDLLAHLREAPADDGTLRPAGTEFDRWYAGGWQMLLPNGGDACTVDGVDHAFHGEAWARGWEVVRERPGAVELAVELRSLPLRVHRRVEVGRTRPLLRIEQQVTNLARSPARMLWGEHPAFGPPLIGEGARLRMPPCRLEAVRCDSRSRLRPGAQADWPRVPAADGREADLSRIPGPEAATHDLCLAYDLSGGWYAIENDALGLGVRVRFDAAHFSWVWIWQLYGDADDEPFSGGYCLAVEPFTGPPGLEAAVAAGAAVEIGPGESRRTVVELTTYRPGAIA
jgi:galactose mutarotase-like enzyme